MVDINQYYKNESAYLKAEDLEPGKKYPLTIAGVEAVEFTQDNVKSVKLALSFQEADKKLTLNKTNAMVISSVHGGESDFWIGKKINVYRAKVQFGDKMVDAVRVDMPLVEASFRSAPQPQRQAMPDNRPMPPDGHFDDDIPF
jgi:hypothetical protein